MPASCGAGLADHSKFPAKLGQWSAALAEMLEVHTTSLDPEDPSAQPELDAYIRLINRFRELAGELRATAAEMVADRTLAMPAHDETVLGGDRAIEAFRGYVERERELVALLRGELARDEKLLAQLIAGPAAG